MARKVWLAIGVVFLALVGWRVGAAKEKAATQKARPADVAVIRTAQARRADLRETLSFTGNVRARNEVDVFPKVFGRIEELQAAVGDRVRAGQVLAVVEHKEIGWQAKAAAASVQAAQAAVALAQTNIDGAQQDYDRAKTLFDAGSAPQAQLDGAKLRVDIAKAQRVSAQAAVAQADAASGLAQQQVANARIESPIAGVVTRRSVLPGTQVGPQTLAFTVQDLGALKLEASVDAASYVRLTRGASVEIAVDEFPQETFHGKVDMLSPALDPTTRRASLEIVIDNHAGRLLPQMFAHAEAQVGELKDQLAISREAVLEAAGGAVVFRVKDGHVESVRPLLGARDGALVAVLGGLSEGDELALTGLGNLTDGLEVKVASAAPPPPAGTETSPLGALPRRPTRR